MKSKIIFELKLNEQDSIIAYEKDDYDKVYENSILYINIGGLKTRITKSSFCFGFGAEMYFRIYNVNEFDDTDNFTNLLVNCFENKIYDFDDKYYFANGNSLSSLELYIYKQNNDYTLLIIKLKKNKVTNKFKADIIKKYIISGDAFAQWKDQISKAYDKRAENECEKIANAKLNKNEWKEYLVTMRTDVKHS